MYQTYLQKLSGEKLKMQSKVVGTRGVIETAEALGVTKARIVQITSSVFRKLRWPNDIQYVKEFIDEYNKPTS